MAPSFTCSAVLRRNCVRKGVPDEEDEEDKEEEERKKRCQELSIELQNEKIQFEELDARLEKVLAEINPAEQELREAKEALAAAEGSRALDTGSAGLSRGPLGWLGAGGAFMSKSEEVKAARQRLKEAREYYEGLLFAVKDINRTKEETKANIEEIEQERAELGCS